MIKQDTNIIDLGPGGSTRSTGSECLVDADEVQADGLKELFEGRYGLAEVARLLDQDVRRLFLERCCDRLVSSDGIRLHDIVEGREDFLVGRGDFLGGHDAVVLVLTLLAGVKRTSDLLEEKRECIMILFIVLCPSRDIERGVERGYDRIFSKTKGQRTSASDIDLTLRAALWRVRGTWVVPIRPPFEVESLCPSNYMFMEYFPLGCCGNGAIDGLLSAASDR